MDFGYSLGLVREKEPLVQCITNFVTVNDCANIILAAGGTPAMTMDLREAREAVEGAQALVCNFGAIDHVSSMIDAGKHAVSLGIPVAFDPVAAGNTSLRRELSKVLLDEVHFTVIRGNASEIRSIAGGNNAGIAGRGVDVALQDEVTEENLLNVVDLVKSLALKLDTVIGLSGKIDIVSDGHRTAVLKNGCATMSRITGSGCMLTSLCGTFCGVDREDPFRAAVSAFAAMGIAGEVAEEKRLINKTGNATFRTDLIDAVFNMTPEDIRSRVRIELI